MDLGKESGNEVEHVKDKPSVVDLKIVESIIRLVQGENKVQGESLGFPSFDPDHSRISINKWCEDIDVRTQRDKMKDYDIIPRVKISLLGRAKEWYDKLGYQHYYWKDLRASLINTFSSGCDIVHHLRKVANIESSDSATYNDFVMEKLSQISRLPFEIPEDMIIRIVVGCISDRGIRNSLTFVMPNCVQSLIDHVSSIRETPRRKMDLSRSRNYQARAGQIKEQAPLLSKENFPSVAKRFRPTDRRCYECGKVGHTRSNCPNKISSEISDTTTKPEPSKKCDFCHKSGHEENNCWVKRRAEHKSVNICERVFNSDYFIPIVVDGKSFQCLLDSGSDCSLIRASVATQLSAHKQPYFVSVQGISKQSILLTEKMNLLVEVQNTNLEITFHIIDDEYLSIDMIIGRDILKDPSLEIVVDTTGSSLKRKVLNLTMYDKINLPIVSQLTSNDTEQLHTILRKYSKNIVKGFPVEKVITGSLQIRLKEDTVISYHPYRLSVSERKVVSDIILDLKTHGIVRDSCSPFASPMILVRKKNGQNRLCVDYRALNRITVKDRYPLPRIDDQLDRLSGNLYFTSLDMASGFHQIPITEESIEKTGFVTPDDHCEFLRMPFGLVNAPAVFQRAINKALGDLKNTIAVVYLDDVLIPSKSIEQGLHRLNIVLKALSDGGFSLNLDKCKFLQNTIEYLGREISKEGVRPSRTKIDALVSSPTPTNVKHIRQFMGLANYFRKFIPEFAAKTSCITHLTKNKIKFEWTPECEEAKAYIIRQLTARPVLTIFDPELQTELHTDASAVGYGAILFQRVNGELKVVAYFSKATLPYESKYHSYELETLAVVNAVKHFRVYLLGIRFTIITDCNALKATKNKRDLLPRIARWWIYLQDFDFDITYRKGKMVQHADYLSRNPPTQTCYRLNSLTDNWLIVEQQKDSNTKELMDRIKMGESNANSQYVIKNSLLFRKLPGGDKLYVPQQCRLGLIRRYHEDNCHIGWDKSLNKMREHFWMPSMAKNVRKFVESCLICLIAKRSSGKKQSTLHPIEKKAVPFHTIHMDCMGPFAENNENSKRYILIMIDAFTKFVLLKPLKTLQAHETVECTKDFVTLFGVPHKIVSDMGTNFTSETFQKLCTSYGIEHHTIAPGISRANGQVERYVDTVANLLRTNLNTNLEWTTYVSRIQLALNTTTNKTTGLSPLKILTGIDGRTPAVGALLSELNLEPEYDDLDAIRSLADERTKENASKMKIRFDKNKVKPTRLEIGTKVLYKSNQIRKSKLDVPYQGCYEVVGILTNDRYKIKRENSRVIIKAARESIRPIEKEVLISS